MPFLHTFDVVRGIYTYDVQRALLKYYIVVALKYNILNRLFVCPPFTRPILKTERLRTWRALTNPCPVHAFKRRCFRSHCITSDRLLKIKKYKRWDVYMCIPMCVNTTFITTSNVWRYLGCLIFRIIFNF